MALTKVTYSMIGGAVVNVKDFGAVGDGVANDTVAIQTAIDSLSTTGGTIYLPEGTYLVARHVGTNDHWGLKIPYSNIVFKGNNAKLKRFNSDISTYALAYPLLFLGEPDSNSTPVSNITIEGLTFEGNNTRHSSSGDYLNDNRTAIVVKNTKNTAIANCKFFTIDSSAIFYQAPVIYDYVNNSYYNTTKNEISSIESCEFYAEPHATPTRALLHAIVVAGVDQCRITNNFFSWCDDCVAGETTYNGPLSGGTYLPAVSGWSFGAVPRSGRDWVFSNNNVYNSSEHAVYFSAVDVVVSNNTFTATELAVVAISEPIKIRSRNAVISGNTMSRYGGGISINEPSFNVSVTGNTIAIDGDSYPGGAIDINSDGLSTYISNRSSYLTNYYPMSNITVAGNSVIFPQDSASGEAHIGIRIYSNISDANYPNGQIQGVSVTSNTFANYKYGVYVFNSLAKALTVEGNTFFAKPFTAAGFTTSTTMNTEAVLLTYQSGSGSSLTSFSELRFDNNSVFGAKYLMSTQNGGGGAGTVDCPWGMTGNKLDYIQYIKTTDIKSFSIYNAFSKNTGVYFLDRTWGGAALDNALGNGTTSDSYRRYTFFYDGANVLFYTNDSATSITL